MSAYKKIRDQRQKPDRVVMLMPRTDIQAVDSWGCSSGMPSRSEAIRHLVKKGLKAAGGELGGTTPAAVNGEKNHSEADSHATE